MNIPVSDRLLEETLAIPQKQAHHSVIPLFHICAVAAAASLMLVSAVCLAVFLFFNRNTSVPVAVSTAPSQQDPSSAVVSTDNTDCSSTEMQKTESADHDTTKQKQSHHEVCSILMNGSSDVDLPHRPVETTVKMPQPESQPQSQAQPAATQPVVPSKPEATETDDITVSNTCYGMVYERLYTKRMYCFISDTASNIYGDSDLFSDQHLATVENDENGWITVSYNPDEYGIIPETNTYQYAFYNEDGAIVYSDSVSLSAPVTDRQGGED